MADSSLLPPPRNGEVPSESEREEVVFAIRSSAFVQSERLQAVIDGAMLGAEQVQDRQLELAIAKLKEVSAEEAFAAFLFTFALQAPFAAGAAAAALRIILTPVLRTRFAFNRLPKSSLGADVASMAQYLRAPSGSPPPRLAEQMRIAANVFEQEARRKIGPKEFAVYSKDIQDWLAKPANYTVAGLKATAASKPLAVVQQPESQTPTDAPGVAIRGAIAALAANQRAAIFVAHARFEQLVREGRLDRAGLADMLEVVAWGELPVSLDRVRKDCKLLYEAAIWARVYGFDFKARQPPMRSTFPLGFEIAGVPWDLVEYWGARFDEPIQAWSQDAARRGDRDTKGAPIQPLRGSIKEAQPIQRRLYLVYEFLMASSKHTANLPPMSFQTSSTP